MITLYTLLYEYYLYDYFNSRRSGPESRRKQNQLSKEQWDFLNNMQRVKMFTPFSFSPAKQDLTLDLLQRRRTSLINLFPKGLYGDIKEVQDLKEFIKELLLSFNVEPSTRDEEQISEQTQEEKDEDRSDIESLEDL